LNELAPIPSLLLAGTPVLSMGFRRIVKIWRAAVIEQSLTPAVKRDSLLFMSFLYLCLLFSCDTPSLSFVIRNISQPKFRLNSSISVDYPSNLHVGDVADHARRYLSICSLSVRRHSLDKD
jgi:hypothetical protein